MSDDNAMSNGRLVLDVDMFKVGCMGKKVVIRTIPFTPINLLVSGLNLPPCQGCYSA